MRYFKRLDNYSYFPVDRSTPYCVEYLDGSKIYYSHDYIRHREDGPAVIYSERCKSYYLNGKCYGNQNDHTDEQWKFLASRLLKLQSFE